MASSRLTKLMAGSRATSFGSSVPIFPNTRTRRFGITNRSGRAQALVGGCIGSALIGATLSAASSGSGVPPINDITTDLDDPPAFAAALVIPENEGRDMAYPEDFVPQVEKRLQAAQNGT